ncbi:MAG: hypothetical protein AABZ32_04980, partial [Bacteroidota bacterium]
MRLLFPIFLFCIYIQSALAQSPSADNPPKQTIKTDHIFFGKKKNRHSEKPLKDSFSKKQKKIKSPKQKDTFLGSNRKDKDTPQKDSFKSKRQKSKATTSDAFTAKNESKNYGEKSNGKRTTRGKNKVKRSNLN